MILSFNEFNALNESNNYGYNDEYSNGSDILESLMTVIAKKGSITETQAYTFLDNVLKETGYELNDEVYENYSEWLGDYASFFDATVNESEEEMDIFLTRRAEMMLENGKIDSITEMGMNKGLLSFGVTKKRRAIRKTAHDAYADKMGHKDPSSVGSKIRTRFGMALPSIPGSKRNKAKHAADSAYHAGRSE